MASLEARIAENKRRAQYQYRPYRPLTEVLQDGAWAGQRAFIIAGGPSLRGFDFERLRGKGRVIAINKAYLNVPFADILFFMDHDPFYRRVKKGDFGPGSVEAWDAFAGIKVFLNILGRQVEDVRSIQSLGKVGLSNSIKRGLYHGNNSACGAVGLAICLHANPIYLLGVDCKFAKDENGAVISHYHGGYGRPQPEGIFKSFVREFERMNRFISRTQFEVINLNPDSALRCFKFGNVDEVLENGKVPVSIRMDRSQAAGLQNDVL